MKVAVTVLDLVTVLLAARRQRAADAGRAAPKAALPFVHTTGALAMVNVFVAVLWT